MLRGLGHRAVLSQVLTDHPHRPSLDLGSNFLAYVIVPQRKEATENPGRCTQVISHFDRGRNYTSCEFATTMNDLDLRQCMGRTGFATTTPWPNRSLQR